MATDKTTVTVGAVRELTSAEIAEREATAGKEAAPYPRDPNEAHKQAVELMRKAAEYDVFSTAGIRTATGTQEDTTETTTTKTSVPRSTVKGEPEKLTKVKLLMDWRDGQGLLHAHGEEMNLPPNEAIKLLDEHRAERSDPPKTEDPAVRVGEAPATRSGSIETSGPATAKSGK
jgi:hypothetical protein